MRNSFVLNSVTSFQDINRSPVNTSPTKNLWTFNKQKRFTKQAVYCDKIYDIQGLKPKKFGVGIGKGTKSDFTKDLTVSPSASRYFNRSLFQANKVHKKGCSIALGRDKSLQNGYILLEPLKVPGPGSYNSNNQKGISYTLRKKTKVINKAESIDSQTDTPGPGTYQNPETLSPKGKYMIAKHSDTGATLFNPKRSSRFLPLKNQVPGPGAYIIPPALNRTSRYINSKYEGRGSRAFTIDKKKSTFDQIARIYNINPGPGSYRNPSQFGQYDGEIYNRRDIMKQQSQNQLNNN